MKSLIETIADKDILLHFPYQRFDYIVDTLREAAIDPTVKSIKIIIQSSASGGYYYRIDGNCEWGGGFVEWITFS